jgi:hypothetical protein
VKLFTSYHDDDSSPCRRFYFDYLCRDDLILTAEDVVDLNQRRSRIVNVNAVNEDSHDKYEADADDVADRDSQPDRRIVAAAETTGGL